MRFLVINGPNLNLLGRREPDVYGADTLSDLESLIEEWASSMSVEAICEQTNREDRIIDLIHTFEGDGVVINPGALTHTSRAIADAIRGVETPVVEVHISNIRDREPWRAESVIAEACVRSIYGRGLIGYRNAMRHLANRLSMPFETIRYGPHDEQVGDLRRGGNDLVVLAHGGIWRQEYERDTTESLAVDLAKRGFDTWNIEYRRLGRGGGWPASGHDVLMALDFIPQLGLASRRVILVGHSAGSYLLMWAAPRTAIEIELHVALAPLIDLEESAATEDVTGVESKLMIDSGAPAKMSPNGVGTILVHGDSDQIVPVGRSVTFAEEHGVELRRTDTDHFSLVDPSKPEWHWVLQRIGATS
jgi:3-dehydroquinate dehydratase-2